MRIHINICFKYLHRTRIEMPNIWESNQNSGRKIDSEIDHWKLRFGLRFTFARDMIRLEHVNQSLSVWTCWHMKSSSNSTALWTAEHYVERFNLQCVNFYSLRDCWKIGPRNFYRTSKRRNRNSLPCTCKRWEGKRMRSRWNMCSSSSRCYASR